MENLVSCYASNVFGRNTCWMFIQNETYKSPLIFQLMVLAWYFVFSTRLCNKDILTNSFIYFLNILPYDIFNPSFLQQHWHDLTIPLAILVFSVVAFCFFYYYWVPCPIYSFLLKNLFDVCSRYASENKRIDLFDGPGGDAFTEENVLLASCRFCYLIFICMLLLSVIFKHAENT